MESGYEDTEDANIIKARRGELIKLLGVAALLIVLTMCGCDSGQTRTKAGAMGFLNTVARQCCDRKEKDGKSTQSIEELVNSGYLLKQGSDAALFNKVAIRWFDSGEVIVAFGDISSIDDTTTYGVASRLEERDIFYYMGRCEDDRFMRLRSGDGTKIDLDGLYGS